MFDEKTRRRLAAQNLQGFGDAFAGRGYDLNRTIQALPAAVRSLTWDVTRTSPTRATDLEDFFNELGDSARVVAPVSEAHAQLFTHDGRHVRGDLARPGGAQGRRSPRAPPTLDVGTRSLRVQRPFLARLRRLSRDLAARRASCAPRCRTVNSALRIGIPVHAALRAAEQGPPGVLEALDDAGDGAHDERRAARPHGDGRRPCSRSCATSARTSRSATTGTPSGPSPPSTSPRPTRPAARSARCSTPAGARTTAMGSMGANEPANGKTGPSRAVAAVPARRRQRGGRRPTGQRRLRGRPAAATLRRATSTARRFYSARTSTIDAHDRASPRARRTSATTRRAAARA